MKGICTDNPGIANLLTNNGVYVDKTDVLLKIITDSLASQFFLSRPRRFGKSLMIDTLLEIFSGKRKLFKDTFIGRSDYDWPVYPVIHLDLSKVVASTPEVLEQKLHGMMRMLARQFDAPFAEAESSGYNFNSLLLSIADAYRDDPRPVWLVGCNYNPKKRGLDKPRIVRFEP